MSHSIRVPRRMLLAGAGAAIAGVAARRARAAGPPGSMPSQARGPKVGGTAAYNINPSAGNPYFHPLGGPKSTQGHGPPPAAYNGNGLKRGLN